MPVLFHIYVIFIFEIEILLKIIDCLIGLHLDQIYIYRFQLRALPADAKFALRTFYECCVSFTINLLFFVIAEAGNYFCLAFTGLRAKKICLAISRSFLHSSHVFQPIELSFLTTIAFLVWLDRIFHEQAIDLLPFRAFCIGPLLVAKIFRLVEFLFF